MAQYVYSIPKISCGHCMTVIKTELKEIDGVQKVDGDILARNITIELQPPAKDEQIKAALKNIGYPAAP